MKIQHLLLTAAFAFHPALLAQEDVSAEDIEIADVTVDATNSDIFMPEEERRAGEVPAMFRDDSLLDDSYTNRELGINVYTAPSISKIFTQLDNLPPIPEAYVLRNRPEKLPINAGSLALEMGYLLADGFIAVRSGHMNDVKPIALDLTRYGKAIGVARCDDMSGELTMSLDVMKYDGSTLIGNIDCRMPVTSTEENTVIPTVSRLKQIGFNVATPRLTEPHYVDPELPFIKTLLSVYEKHTGLKGECLAIGGGTYVHDINNGVAFGCILPDLDTHMHGANEFMPIKDILMSAKIFADAIIQICK